MRDPIDILEFNNSRDFVVPSAQQYPHQWLWDACFHAIILADIRPDLAWRELKSLLAEQRRSGMLAHITFNTAVNPENYRPNPSDWGTGTRHSGITQTPLVASALKLVFQRTRNDKLLRKLYPAVVRYHAWIKRFREDPRTGLVGIVHPWESGMDNSPVYDAIKDKFLLSLRPSFSPPPRADTKRVPSWQRPTDDYYRFYWGLNDLFKRWKFDDHKMAKESPFFVGDVLFNAVWAKANEDLSVIASYLGKKKDSDKFMAWCEKARDGLEKFCWDEKSGFFYSYDLRAEEQIPVKTVGGFVPLWAGAVTAHVADRLVEELMDRTSFYYHLGIPSTSYQTARFDRYRYWRGPIWINMHWLVMEGLKRYGYFDIASKLVEKSRALTEKNGFWEYYDPFTGQGLGASHFSWSTLSEVMAPLEPPAVFKQKIVVMPLADTLHHAELRTLYNHPKTRKVTLETGQITSGPPIFTNEVLEAVRTRAMQALTPVQESQFGRRLHLVSSLTQELVQNKRGAWQDYPRICDLVSVAAHQVLKPLGYQCDIYWTPDLHYFLRVLGPSRRWWIVDLSPSQFSWHPVSRIPLLMERATLDINAALKEKRDVWLLLQGLLAETQFAVQRNWTVLERDRMDRYEREAFLAAAERHFEAIHKLSQRVSSKGKRVLKRHRVHLEQLTEAANRRNFQI